MLTPMPTDVWYCTSEDTLPTTPAQSWEFGWPALHNGQPVLVGDTGKVLTFDEAGGEWREL